MKPDAVVGDYAKSLQAYLVSQNGRFILSEALHRDLKQGLSVLR